MTANDNAPQRQVLCQFEDQWSRFRRGRPLALAHALRPCELCLPPSSPPPRTTPSTRQLFAGGGRGAQVEAQLVPASERRPLSRTPTFKNHCHTFKNHLQPMLQPSLPVAAEPLALDLDLP